MQQYLNPFSKKSEWLIKIGIAIFLIVIIVFLVLFRVLHSEKKSDDTILSTIVTEKNDSDQDEKEELVTKEKEEKQEVNWMVDIKGEVESSGTYQVTENMRVVDVINLAGGLTINADTTLLNLSQKVKDQMVIVIYSKEEVENMKQVIKMREELLLNCKNATIVNDACIKEEEQEKDPVLNQQLVNINTATKEELLTLPGIGEKKADAIIEYRNQFGPFQKTEDIMLVNGIGESMYEAIKDQITIGS